MPPLKGRVHGLQGGLALPLPDGLFQKTQKAHAVPGARQHVGPQGPGLGGVGLGPAAAHGHHGPRVLPAGPVDGLAGLLVPGGGDGAGIDNVGVCLLAEGDRLVAPGPELLLHGLGLVLVHLAAKGVDGDFHSGSDSPCAL